MEIWKSVPSKPDILVSNLGRVQLPKRIAIMPNGGKREYNPSPRFGTKTRSKKGAAHVYMGIYNKFYGNMKVHRLVCEAFNGPPPLDNSIVIHLDENGLNNKAENLRWGTQKENLNMPKFIAYCKSRTGENSPFIKGRRT